MSNKLYDVLKAIALFTPAIITFVAAIVEIWNIPYGAGICATLSAFNTLVAAIVVIANKNYKKKSKKEGK